MIWPASPRLSRKTARVVLAGAFLAALLTFGLTLRPAHPEHGDAPQYLAAAYHLVHHGTFSEAPEVGPVAPEVGREPGYALFLAGLMAALPAPGGELFTPACLNPAAPCSNRLYRPMQWANVLLAAASGLLLFAAARTAGCRRGAALAAALLLLANNETMKSRHWVASDYLALFLVSLLLLAAARAWTRPQRPERWALAGLALAALTLTKAVFLVYAGLALAGLALAGFGLALAGPGAGRRRLLAGGVAFALAFTLPVGGWMARNQAVSGDFALTRSRAGIALSTREVFNHMTPAQYLCAFVFWTRGFGDDLAQARFPRAVWQPFLIDQPGGFYDFGQNRNSPWIAAAVAGQGLSVAAASQAFDRTMRQEILARPLTHLATTLPLFYRGVWIDEFIPLTLPALLWLTAMAWRRRRAGGGVFLLLVSPGWFNLLFYALTSLNIPRYQITAVPVLALAGGMALEALWRWRGATRSAVNTPEPGSER